VVLPVAAILALVLGAGPAAAAPPGGGGSTPVGPGGLDTTFSKDGKVTASIGENDSVGGIAVLADGKIVVAGTGCGRSGCDFELTRFTSGGSIDTTFGAKGKTITDFSRLDDTAKAIALDSLGRIVVVGSSERMDGDADVALARYTADGKLDTSFGTGGKVVTQLGSATDTAYGVAIDPSGRIVVAGEASPYPNAYSSPDPRVFAARYTPAGVLDTVFGAGGIAVYDRAGAAEHGRDVLVDAGGRVVVAAAAFTDPRWDFLLVGFTDGGVLDATFGSGGVVTTSFHDPTGLDTSQDQALGIAAHGTGLVVAGHTESAFAVARYDANGTLDPGFGSSGKVLTPFGTRVASGQDVAVDGNGRIVVAGVVGDQTSGDFALARYDSAGALDTTFGASANGTVTTNFGYNDRASDMALDPTTGKIVVAGTTVPRSATDFALARYVA
jgi:uncharacterized delta-60 repeat protein